MQKWGLEVAIYNSGRIFGGSKLLHSKLFVSSPFPCLPPAFPWARLPGLLTSDFGSSTRELSLYCCYRYSNTSVSHVGLPIISIYNITKACGNNIKHIKRVWHQVSNIDKIPKPPSLNPSNLRYSKAPPGRSWQSDFSIETHSLRYLTPLWDSA